MSKKKSALLREVGFNIRNCREEKNITRKNFADRLCISPQQLSNIENGRIDIGAVRIKEIAAKLEVGYQDILKTSFD